MLQRVWGQDERIANETLRLDPFALPAEISIPSKTGVLTVGLDRTRAQFRGKLPSGIAVAISMPVSDYSGVAARLVPVGNGGAIRVSLELLHRDPSLTVCLAIANDPGEIAADWQAWGNMLRLPLLLITPDGKVSVEHAGPEAVQRPTMRRVRRFLAGRRSRFAGRRKPGHARSELVDGSEIIARN